MGISPEDIKKLREMTSCGVMDCRNALHEAAGDFNKAKAILLKRGLELAAKKGSRDAKEGRIEAYIHPGNKIGVIVEINCETDFVAKNEDFVKFSKDVAMHIAAVNPTYVKEEDIPESELADIKDLKSYVKENCLLSQPFVKDSSKTIQQITTSLIGTIGENIFVSRFNRFKVNEVA